MEDLPPISVIENDTFCVEMMKRLNIQRKQGHLCDLTLVTKDDEELKAMFFPLQVRSLTSFFSAI